MMMSNFVIRKIILQREEKIYKLQKILEKTTLDTWRNSIKLQIKEHEKDLEYFVNKVDRKTVLFQ